MSGGGSGGSSAPASTTANNTNTVINDVPAWEQQYMTNLLGQATTEAAQPYSQFPGQQVAGFTDPQTQAFSQIQNLEGNGTGGVAATQGAAATGQATAGANTANTISGAGSPWLTASAMYNPAAAASPFMNAAAQTTTPQGISSYMSPYLGGQVAGLNTLAHQNWDQFTAPGINNSFISSGQAGSGRNEQVLGQQANLANQALTAQIANAEQNAYTTAGQQAGQAASTLGNLANTAGSTAQSEAANLQNIGTGLGNLAATQAGAQGNAATNLANTANTVQNTGITGASALQAVGQQQQNQAQTNINTAEQNFQNQTMWPETQTSFLSDILRGLPTAGGASTSAGQTPTTSNMIGSTSPLGSLAGSLVGAGAIAGTGGIAAKRGGLIQSMMRGGRVKGYAEGGQTDNNADVDSFFMSDLGGSQPQDDGGIHVDAPPQSPLPQAPDTSSQFNPAPDLSKMDQEMLGALPKAPPQPNEKTQSDSPLNVDREQSVQPSTISDHMGHGDADPKTDYETPSGSRSPLSAGMPQLDPNKMRQYQLLEMAKGLLTPAHSGAEALGNAFGNYAQSGTDFMKMQQEQDRTLAQMADTRAYREGMLQNTANRNASFAQNANTNATRAEILQQNADTNASKADTAQQKADQAQWQTIPDQLGGFLQFNKKTGETKTIAPVNSGSTSKIDATTGQPLTGQAYLDDLKKTNPSMAAQVKAMDEGDLNFPTGFAAKSPYWQQRLDALYQYHPGASQQSAAALKAFNQGPQGNQTRFLNVAVNHLDTLSKLTDALDNNDTKALNTIGNFWQSQTGSPAPTNFNTAKNIVGAEVTKAVIGAGGTGEDRDKAQKVIDAANSPAQLKGAIQTYQNLMSGQLSGLKQQYEVSTGRKDYDRYLTPAAKTALTPQASPQGNPAPTAIPPAAIQMLRKNPSLAPAFQQKYGVSPQQYLGQ